MFSSRHVVFLRVDPSVSSLPRDLMIVQYAFVDHVVQEVDDGRPADAPPWGTYQLLVRVNPDVAAASAVAFQAP